MLSYMRLYATTSPILVRLLCFIAESFCHISFPDLFSPCLLSCSLVSYPVLSPPLLLPGKVVGSGYAEDGGGRR